MRDTLVFIEYLETGLVPVCGFQSEDIESFENGMNSLSPLERRKVNRKFRKTFRKLCKEKLYLLRKNEPASRAFKKAMGIGISNPSKNQLRTRRRYVHNKITKEIFERTRNEF